MGLGSCRKVRLKLLARPQTKWLITVLGNFQFKVEQRGKPLNDLLVC